MPDSKDKIVSVFLDELNKVSASQIIHASSSALAFINDSGIIIDQNQEFKKSLPQISNGQNISDFISPKEQAIQFKTNLKNKVKTVSAEINKSQHMMVNIKLTLIDSHSDLSLYLASAKTENTFSTYNLFQQFIDSIPDNIFIKDTNCNFILANNWATKIMGVKSSDELLGRNDFHFFSKKYAKSYFEDDKKVIETGTTILNKQEKVIINNETKWYSTTKVPLLDKNGQIVGLMGMGRDITQHINEKRSLKKAQKEAEKADKLKSTFLANLSHEIRTPLNGILGFSQFLKQKSHSIEKQHKYLDIIHNNGKQLLMLLNDIIDISMIESNQVAIKKHLFRMNSLLDHLYVIFEGQINEKGANLILKSNPGLPYDKDIIYSDDYRLHQVLGNLIGNAIKFTKKGTIEFGYTLDNKTVTFYVQDTGIGISTKDQKEIFLRFRQADESVTRKFGGTGLGLSICKGLVEMLGGNIYVESTPRKGSRFYFTIPYINSEKKDCS